MPLRPRWGCKRALLDTLHLLHGGVWKVFFLVLGMGAIVDHVNGGLLAPESPHWAMGAIVDLFCYRRPSGPGKPTVATANTCCSAGSLEKGSRARAVYGAPC